MTILFDETVHLEYQKRFAQHHPYHVVSNVHVMGWNAGSAIMAGLTPAQQDKLLLQLAKKSRFALFITADLRFHRQPVTGINVIVGDAGDHAPTLNFWNALTPLLDEQIACFASTPAPEERRIVLRVPEYEPDAETPVPGSRLSSAKLRPIRNTER